jgi:hypothetical protein
VGGRVRECAGGKGGEMTQTLYAHMNKIKIKKKERLLSFSAALDNCWHRAPPALLLSQTTAVIEDANWQPVAGFDLSTFFCLAHTVFLVS